MLQHTSSEVPHLIEMNTAEVQRMNRASIISPFSSLKKSTNNPLRFFCIKYACVRLRGW